MFKCKQLLRRICVVSYVFLLCGGLVNASNLVSKTNTLIGTQGNGWASGYLYPGATYPFGMVQFTPTYFTKQLGFVINQLSGAGCDHMGNFPTLPIAGALRVSPDSILNMQTPVGKEIGTAGYYSHRRSFYTCGINRYGTYGYGSLYVFFQGKAGYRDYRRRSSRYPYPSSRY